MNRTELFSLARAAGWVPGKPMGIAAKGKVKKSLAAILTPELLAAAPRIAHGDGMRAMTQKDAIEALLEELK